MPHETAAVSAQVLCTPYNHAPCHFMQSHIHKVYACLTVTCHLHFWQNDRDLLRATAVTRGWNGGKVLQTVTVIRMSVATVTASLAAEISLCPVIVYNHRLGRRKWRYNRPIKPAPGTFSILSETLSCTSRIPTKRGEKKRKRKKALKGVRQVKRIRKFYSH